MVVPFSGALLLEETDDAEFVLDTGTFCVIVVPWEVIVWKTVTGPVLLGEIVTNDETTGPLVGPPLDDDGAFDDAGCEAADEGGLAELKDTGDVADKVGEFTDTTHVSEMPKSQAICRTR